MAARAATEFRKGQTTTDARWVAGRDLRNIISMAAILYLYKDNYNTLVANMDATQFVVDFGIDSDVATVKDPPPASISNAQLPPLVNKPPPLTVKGSPSLRVMIKQYTIMAASGHLCTTYLLADPNLEANHFIHFASDRLSIGNTSPMFPVEVCFCSTRSGNTAFH